MSLARLALKSSIWRLAPPASSFSSPPELVKRFTTTTSGSDDPPKSDAHHHQVFISDDTKKSKLSHKKKPRTNLWWNPTTNNRNLVPSLSLSELVPSVLGNALVQATQNMNRLLENLSPSNLIGRFKENDECYKVKYQMPGLSKEDVKITIEDDGVLVVRGKHKEEEEAEADDQNWSYASHGYYSTSILLPEDAKIDEMKDGVLCINIPKDEGRKKKKKEFKEVHVH